jgi:putative tryptophan/tyrosine transport system substrate-binding protein
MMIDTLVTRRRDILLGGMAAAAAGSLATGAHAAAAGRSFRIGLLHYVHKDDKFINTDDVRLIKEELQNLGYREGGNTTFFERYGERNLDATKRFAVEMVEWKADIICSFIANANKAAQAATTVSQTPVVCWASFPLHEGLAQSYRRPGSNFTGFSYDPYSQLVKVRVLKLAVPNLKRVGYFYNHTYAPAKHTLPELQQAAEMMGLDFKVYEALRQEDFEPTVAAMKRDGCGGVVVGPHEFFNANGAKLGRLFFEAGLPASGNQLSIVRAGGLAAYGASKQLGWRAMAHVVDRVLKGAKPADIPFERGFKSLMVLNVNAAKNLGLNLSPSLIAEADTIIE